LIAELLLVTSSIAVSMALSRLALGEVFRLVRISATRAGDANPPRR
jgi:hypothetical protein